MNHFFCIYIYSNEIQRNKNYRIMLSRNHWKALFTMVWGWLFSSVIWREKLCVTIIKIMLAFWTPCKYSVFKGYKEYWDFPNMIESIKHQKNPPKQFLKSNYVWRTHIISFRHKDAIGRETIKCLILAILITIDFTII